MKLATLGHTRPTRRHRLAAFAIQHEQQAIYKRTARRLTPVLLQRLQIPAHESTLVTWLTDRDCRTNEEAVREWATQQLQGQECIGEPPVDRITALSARLQTVLSDIQENFP